MKKIAKNQILFCFSGPAASGKSTICRELVRRCDNLFLSISTTTRPPREGEVNGKDYFFVSQEEFQARLKQNLFIEHATFSNHLYGTETRNVEQAGEGRDILFDVEVHGARTLKQLYGNQVVVVFLFPPSFEILEARLRARGKDSEEQIQSRLSIAQEEVSVLQSEGFSNYQVVNDQLEDAILESVSIVQTERNK